ncbi:MAG: nicotinate phosphoribosyltransferase [Alphaproteobacteria bacterium]|nr:MAG: nicotinate phosphoribosyltransferase [Alphaproteobacteria bacterium]
MIDIAKRVWDHTWKIDPIVRSVLDTDFYKLLMAQLIFYTHRQTRVTFSLINRSDHVPMARLVDEGALREQLDHVRSLRLSRGESTWLRGNTFYGKRWMFTPDFLAWLEGFRFPEYHLERKGDQYELTFEGPWIETTMWEIPALAILMELRSRAVLQKMGKLDLQVLYARAMTRLWEKIERLRPLAPLSVADFGTRRRHGFLWQDWCVQAMAEGLGEKFTGTSNCLLAMRHELEAVGTNAHELQMVYAALSPDDDALRDAPYRVCEDWMRAYEGNLRIILPDTYGSRGFFDRAPEWLAGWTGVRVDSGDPATGAEIAMDFWRRHGQDPREKLVIFSDGLDVDRILDLHRRFAGRVRVAFGWGTLLTNDFRGLVPGDALAPFSLVCKAVSADGRPCVKLSDNPEKAVGPAEEVARYRRVFGVGAQEAIPVEV